MIEEKKLHRTCQLKLNLVREEFSEREMIETFVVDISRSLSLVFPKGRCGVYVTERTFKTSKRSRRELCAIQISRSTLEESRFVILICSPPSFPRRYYIVPCGDLVHMMSPANQTLRVYPPIEDLPSYHNMSSSLCWESYRNNWEQLF